MSSATTNLPETTTTTTNPSEPDSHSRQQLSNYNIYIITWNVGSKFPDNISLRNLLGLNTTADEQHLPDIYALGLQEVNAQPQQQVLDLFKDDPWTRKARHLLRDFDYVLFKSEQMQGLLLSMFIQRKHLPFLHDIEAEFTRTGFGGIWGNKGAVSIRFNLFGCGMTFVAAHLAAHDQHLDERIEDYKQIIEHHHYHVPRYREIHDHEYVFWFGDLNFRLRGDDSAEEVAQAVKDEKCSELIKRDQLLYVREKTQQAFQYMLERTPEFPPTFKFKEGTTEYDMKRRPAWTDRIMYAVQPSNRQPNMQLEVIQRSYKSIPGYNISDHKPVVSEFQVKMYPQVRAPCVGFNEIPTWIIDDEYTVVYHKPLDFEERDHDWIGVFPVNFSSLAGYIAYEYVNQAESPPTPPDSPVDSYFDAPPSTHRHGHHHHRNRQRLRREQQADSEEVRIDFSDDINMKNGENYLLIYFQNTGLRGVSSVAGISNVFRAEKRPRSERRHSHSD